MNHSPELMDALLRRMLPPNNESITKISREEGISEQTLRNWRDKARKEGYATPGTDAIPDNWSTQDKFLVVVETASMNETELAEYARKKGLYVEQIKAWKDACMNANGGIAKEASRLNRELKDSEKERRKLEKELQRKEKALAEAAALLVLSKKANAIWGGSRGRMISASDRENAVLLINEAIASGASCKKACWTVWIVNFNTSHVTVYRPLQAHRFFHHTFQYIPCYGLSQCSALLRLLSAYFNTSHVTVYPMAKSLIHIIPTDFNTSHVTVYLYLQTQWIYGLVNFNTSHVTVYRFLCSRNVIVGSNFNTSHVTVYHREQH